MSILYRTHKALPAPSKIHSLYVFDALSRAARHQVNKHELSAGSSQGNAATFLAKIEGILEGLFQDMLSVGKDEFKVSVVQNSLTSSRQNVPKTCTLSSLQALRQHAYLS